MNSVRSLERALVYEISRQTKALEAGETIVQETRHWNEDAGATASMRSKEEAFDYRYFPEPDIPAIEPAAEWIEELRAALPELPRARRERYVAEHGLKPEVARVLVGDRAASALFEETVALGAEPVGGRQLDHAGPGGPREQARRRGRGPGHAAPPRRPARAASPTTRSAAPAPSRRSRKPSRPATRSTPSSSARACARSPTAASSAPSSTGCSPTTTRRREKFRDGNEGVIGFLVGQVMKASGGSANPKLAQELLRERLQG